VRHIPPMSVFITLEPPCQRHGGTEAVTADCYESPWFGRSRRFQIFTIEQLLKGARMQMTPIARTFKQMPKVKPAKLDQMTLDV